ncbi:MAG: hypothetical protein CMJ64_18610 [Planctomycetaceae bacterium]|nr:hypothetical protein [Planctomycetaceae bacterium]
MPKNAIEKRRDQLSKKQAKSNPKSAKIETPLSSLVDVPDPEPPPIFDTEPAKPRDDRREKTKRKKKKKRLKAKQREERQQKTELDPPPVVDEPELEQTETKDQPPHESVPKPPPRPKTTSITEPAAKEVAEVEKASPKSERVFEPGTRSAKERFKTEESDLQPGTAEPTERHRGRSLQEDAQTPSKRASAAHKSVAAFSEPEVPEAEPPPLESMEEDGPVHGYQADRDKVATVRWLATALLAIALFGMIPAVREIAEHFRVQDGSLLHRWVYASLLICGLQLAYAGYLAQLPDWSSVWVVTIFSLIVAGAYAAMLCLTLLAGVDSQFVQVLDLAERLRGGKATGWCFIMLCVTGLLAYSSGRVGSRWRQAFAM